MHMHPHRWLVKFKLVPIGQNKANERNGQSLISW